MGGRKGREGRFQGEGKKRERPAGLWRRKGGVKGEEGGTGK
jgi:hypothetical protein